MTWLPSGTMFPVDKMIGAPLGWRDFLKRRPDLSSEKFTPAVVAMTTAKFLRLSQVQAFGARIRYRRDVYPDGRPGDKWEVADSDGDCEDIALAKMVRLLDYGWPRGAIRLTLCAIVSPGGRFQYHAVLQIDTDHGTWVLDNRMRYPRIWTRLPYRWLWREKPGSTFWEKFKKE